MLSVNFFRVSAANDDPREQAFYQIEYRWIPVMVATYQEDQNNDLSLFTDLELWQGYTQKHYPDIHKHFTWDRLQVYTYSQPNDSLIVVVYDFPEPFTSPLAAYGAVVVRPSAITYYTFELSYTGDYVLGTTDTDWTHSSLAFCKPKTIQEFIGIVCEKENIPLIKQYPPEY
jgi:hypothetical protein